MQIRLGGLILDALDHSCGENKGSFCPMKTRGTRFLTLRASKVKINSVINDCEVLIKQINTVLKK